MRDKVSGAIAIPRQAGDVPQPCRTGFGWYPKEQFACSGKEQSDFAEPYAVGFPRSSISHGNSAKTAFRENGLQRPAKGGSTPAFACQRAAIAPLPYSNLQP